MGTLHSLDPPPAEQGRRLARAGEADTTMDATRAHHPDRMMSPGAGARTLHGMEWVALLVWIIIAMLALPVALGALSGSHGLGLQAVAAIGGLVFVALFIILDGPLWAGWLAVGLAVTGIVADVWGAEHLLSDTRPVSADLQGIEELEAGLLGVQLPLFGVALLCSLCLGVDLVTVA
jgi:hypothetical protein